MLSRNPLGTFYGIIDRLAKGDTISLEERKFVSNMAEEYPHLADELQKALHKLSILGVDVSSMDKFIADLGVGFPDRERHLASSASVDDFIDFFVTKPFVPSDEEPDNEKHPDV
jgi:hypothetical protein